MITPALKQTHSLTQSQLARIEAILQRDPVANAYALADLQPRFSNDCRWLVEPDEITAGATHEESGLVLFFMGLEPPIVVACGDDSKIAAVLTHAVLPPAIYMSVSPTVHALLEQYYDFGADVRPMARMALRPDHPAPAGVTWPAARKAEGLQLRKLTTQDAPQLQALYELGGDFAPDSFDAYQLDDGTFFGIVAEDGQIMAAGGTHVTAPPVAGLHNGVAAIGNMYTHPAWRGRGLAKTVLTAIVSRLREMEIGCIVLNVDRRNFAARRLYERFGFYLHCEYLEGSGTLRL